MVIALELQPASSRRLGRHAATLIQVAREALSNAARHGAARTSRVSLRERGGSLVLEIEDDGRGFEVERVAHGQGLDNMRDRIEALGGRLKIESNAAIGTRIIIALPG
jgi:signal transduction histidine kinase